MVDITKSKSFKLIGDIGSKVFIVRVAIILFFLVLSFIFVKYIKYIVAIGGIVVVLSAIVLYAWGGWKTVKSGYSLLDSAKLGFIVGLFVGVFAEFALRQFSVLNLVFEAVLGAILTFLGALITKKFKLANATR